MAKMFAQVVGWVLIVVGVLNFFVPFLHVMPAHAILHIIAGALGVYFARTGGVGYARWVGVIGVLLAVIGFLGVDNLLGFVDLPMLFNVIHLVIGVWGLWAGFGKQSSAMPA
jgi:hypothetical protein